MLAQAKAQVNIGAGIGAGQYWCRSMFALVKVQVNVGAGKAQVNVGVGKGAGQYWRGQSGQRGGPSRR